MRKPRLRQSAYFGLFALRGQAIGKVYQRMVQEDRDGIPPETTPKLLTALLAHCERNVPYYAELMRDLGESYLEDPEGYLARLPMLTKDILRTRIDDLKASDLPGRKWFYNSTGGSTGEPVTFIQDWENATNAGAVTLLFSKLAGWEVGEPMIQLWGSRQDVTRHTDTWQSRLALKLSNRTILDGFVMSPAEMRQFVAVLDSVKPKLIIAYADTIYEVAKFAECEGLKVRPQAAIITSAGMLYPFMREKIEKVFQTRVYNRYGSREVGDVACERPGYRGLWVAPWGNYVEIVDSDGRRVPDGHEGEILVTSLTNFAMPLIRYRIGDRGVLAPRQSAGRPPVGQVLAEVLGRSNDVLRSKNGAIIHGTYFIAMLSFRDWIQKYQVIQKDPSRVVFRIVRAQPECPQAELDELVAKTRLVLGEDCEVSFDFVDDIPPISGSGKFRYIVSEGQT